jgi:hypothetical protein
VIVRDFPRRIAGASNFRRARKPTLRIAKRNPRRARFGYSDAIACRKLRRATSVGAKTIASFLCGPALFARVFVTL